MHSQVTPPPDTYSPNTSHSRSSNLWAILLLFGGFALRLFNLGAESLWYDETVSVYLAGQSIADLLSHTARDIHPPAYYLLLHFWRFLSHPSVAFGLEYLYAWPSLFFGLFVMALTYAITKRTFGSSAALWALAFAALQPTQIWFAQEVRMYALGAFALMLTLWAVSPLLSDKTLPSRLESNKPFNKTLYVLAALCGLYTLYYFLFWLLILNPCILARLWKRRHLLRAWILLQFLVLIGWLPWLPTFFRQATDPPVPPWRLPWQTIVEFISATNEAIAAYWVGHIASFTVFWPSAIVMVLTALAFLVYAKSVPVQTRLLWLTLCFGPVLLLLIVSVVGPPIYHVRYVATYAPLFAILLGALLSTIPRVGAAIIASLFTLMSAISLHQLWTNPLYAADDHRNAVATVARDWRPGDAILVNAGWVYTALSVYWPSELPSPDAVRPPAIAEVVRLDSSVTSSSPITLTNPVIFRSGSVNGDSNLGWSLPESDFFAITQEVTTEALAQLAANHTRIWHYRLYDTVNDPTGVIRQWLGDNTTLEVSQPVPGRDFLRIERYRTDEIARPVVLTDKVLFPDIGVSLLSSSHLTTTPAGEMLFVNLTWDAAPSLSGTNLPAISLRLYDSQGQMLLQEDTPLAVNPNHPTNQPVALPLPADTIPAQYRLELLLYSPETLLPYPAMTAGGDTIDTPIQLGEVFTQLPQIIPHSGSPLATFDYINLLAADLPATSIAPGESFTTAWTWQPEPSDYSDHYIGHLELAGADSTLIALADFNLGGDAYLSSTWPARYPLKQRVTLQLPGNISSGRYQVRLSIARAADSQTIPARQPWRIGNQPYFTVGEIEVVNSTQE